MFRTSCVAAHARAQSRSCPRNRHNGVDHRFHSSLACSQEPLVVLGVLFSFLHTIFDALLRLPWPSYTQNPILLTAESVIVHKKLFQFFYELLTQIPDVLHVCITMVIVLNRNNSVVSLAPFLLALLSFDDANRAATQQTTGESWFVHQNQDVHRITVISDRGWDKSKVVRKRHSRRQNFFQLKDSLLRVE